MDIKVKISPVNSKSRLKAYAVAMFGEGFETQIFRNISVYEGDENSVIVTIPSRSLNKRVEQQIRAAVIEEYKQYIAPTQSTELSILPSEDTDQEVEKEPQNTLQMGGM